MLCVAEKTGHYNQLVNATLTDLPFDDCFADAVVATGVFTHGHVGTEAFPEILRILKPRGWFVITVRDAIWQQLEEASANLELQGRWRLHHRTEPNSLHPGKGNEEEHLQSIVIWQVL